MRGASSQKQGWLYAVNLPLFYYRCDGICDELCKAQVTRDYKEVANPGISAGTQAVLKSEHQQMRSLRSKKPSLNSLGCVEHQ